MVNISMFHIPSLHGRKYFSVCKDVMDRLQRKSIMWSRFVGIHFPFYLRPFTAHTPHYSCNCTYNKGQRNSESTHILKYWCNWFSIQNLSDGRKLCSVSDIYVGTVLLSGLGVA